jgi:hypothetical protein
MSAQGTLPSARAASVRLGRCLAACVSAAAIGACGGAPDAYTVAIRTASDAHHVASVRLVRCGSEWCESLWVGPAPDRLRQIVTLPAQSERCTEIAWTRDGKRVAFLINGSQLRLYDPETRAPAGLIDLVPIDSQPTTRVARGLTFSDNGAAITFDDCPRERSGCKPGMVAIR